MVDRETGFQIIISIATVLGFIAGTIYVGQTYRTNGHITPDGGLALVVSMGTFILVMGAAGLWLSQQDFDGDADSQNA